MQCILEKFQLGQIAFLTENCEGINAIYYRYQFVVSISLTTFRMIEFS